MDDLQGLLACPRCEQALDKLHCSSCRVDYPQPGGVPWLFPDPGAAITDWRQRWQLAVQQLHADRQRVQLALAENPRASTRCRLQTLATGYDAQVELLAELLEPLRLASGAPLDSLLALRTRLPTAQGIFSYDANVHRDWCWGAAETNTALHSVLSALGSARPERVLVLGAGAGRLAYDMHQHTSASVTAAVDLNPLLVYAGHRVASGGSVDLVEFPLAPQRAKAAAIRRTLAAPAAARPGMHFLLADVLRPPFAEGKWDLIVTPWLLDVVDAAPAELLSLINRLLTEDGFWINQGSVTFDGHDPAARLTLEELLEVADETGFADLQHQDHRVAYMQCPDSRHGRQEVVTTMSARRCRIVPRPERHQNLPDWIARGRAPVPALPAFQTQAASTKIHAYIMSLIDGRRTLKDMARVLEQQRLMPSQEAEVALRGFLTKMLDEANRNGRL